MLDKSDYEEKVKNHLDDSNIYEKLNNNPMKKLQSNMNTTLKDLEKKKKLNRQQYLHLYSSSLHTPRFYATIKLHKEGNPIRPIVSFCNTPTENVSKFLTKILNPLTDFSDHKIKSVFDAKNKLESLMIPDTHCLVSFDVKSLFTKIPQSLAL